MNKYENALKQMCLQCKTKPSNCNKNKCNRYNAFKELVEMYNKLYSQLGLDSLMTPNELMQISRDVNKDRRLSNFNDNAITVNGTSKDVYTVIVENEEDVDKKDK